ncbi:hypothetical protein [Vibrio coralliirubri]|uniref:hypothetical protein n=1 Tax=Vibrio coralliirubri TaxID=1516159 RepID=UPI000A3B6A7F|nr:hypothetical protein [Vibrio coralliirubri]
MSRETSGSWGNAPDPWIVSDKCVGQAWKVAPYWVAEVGHSTNPDAELKVTFLQALYNKN